MSKLPRPRLSQALILTAVLSLFVVRAAGGVQVGQGEEPTHLKNVSIEQAVLLHEFRDVDVAIHRGANNQPALAQSVASGANYVDLDAKRIGDRIYVTHARYFGGLLGVDVESWSLFFGPPDWTLDDVCRELMQSAGEATPGVMLEPKRGADLSTRIQMYRELEDCGLPYYVESLDWRELDELRAVFQAEDHLIYVVTTQTAMETFLAEQPQAQRRNVLINPSLVARYGGELRASGVSYIMAGTADPEEARVFLEVYGVDGISTHALDVAQAIKRGPGTFTLAVNGVEGLADVVSGQPAAP